MWLPWRFHWQHILRRANLHRRLTLEGLVKRPFDFRIGCAGVDNWFAYQRIARETGCDGWKVMEEPLEGRWPTLRWNGAKGANCRYILLQSPEWTNWDFMRGIIDETKSPYGFNIVKAILWIRMQARFLRQGIFQRLQELVWYKARASKAKSENGVVPKTKHRSDLM